MAENGAVGIHGSTSITDHMMLLLHTDERFVVQNKPESQGMVCSTLPA